MASMAFSTLTMFFPQNSVMIAALILCALFFGVYIPWQERKKKGGKKQAAPKSAKLPVRRQTPERPVSRSGEASRLEQLETLKSAGLITEQEYKDRKQKLNR